MFVVIIMAVLFCTVLCYACLVQGAEADEWSERQYQEFQKRRAEESAHGAQPDFIGKDQNNRERSPANKSQ